MLQRFAILRSTLPSRKLDSLAKQVCESSVASVLKRTAARTQEMTLSEARGYIRARAAQVVNREAQVAIARDADADVSWKGAIVRLATERIVSQVLRQAAVGVPRATMRVAA